VQEILAPTRFQEFTGTEWREQACKVVRRHVDD
jgi:hypothetical protein